MFRCVLTLIILTLCGCNNKQVEDPLEKKRQQVRKAAEEDPFAFANYCNDRFTYCIGYPVFMLFPGNESSNGDGRIFADKNGEEVLRVYGKTVSENYKSQVLATALHNDLQSMEEVPGLVVTKKSVSGTAYIIYGNTPNRVFVKKALLKNGVLASAILQYSKNEKDMYNKVADKIIASLE